ncbi:MAG: hypothetical protein GXP59_09805 [Deltaproteobacteria bacterium]|nr:hypothetical protein [Deltaproteobacteria bacterium]
MHPKGACFYRPLFSFIDPSGGKLAAFLELYIFPSADIGYLVRVELRH